MAVNLRLIGAYKSEYATATASSSASGYDPQSTVNIERQTIWTAGGTGASWLQLDLGSAKAVTGACIANHNGTGWSGAEVQYYDGATWQTFGAALSGLTTGNDHYITAASQTRQLWRIYTSGATAAMEVGCFYLGTATTLSQNPSFQPEYADVYNVERGRATSGLIVAEQYGRYVKRFDLPFTYITSTTLSEIQSFLQTEGGPLRPFFYVPPDESGSATQGQCWMVRFEPISFAYSRVFGDIYTSRLTLLEEV